MSKVFSNFPIIYKGIATSKSIPASILNLSVQRLSSDPYFYADVTINNAVSGSRYLLVDNDNFDNVLDTGLITSNPQILSNIPSYGSPMIMMLRLRNASYDIKYKEYSALVPHSKQGAVFYCAQEVDE